jgi:CubicO group peptidase (beta-lactamase class C family)
MGETATDAALAKRLDWVPARLAELLARYRVPAGSVAVWHEGAEYVAAEGLANVPAQVDATPDTLFLIGSITKIFTASLVMRLVDEGLVDLDAPVRRYVPEFRLSDPDAADAADAADAVTVRRLLTHTSGMVGDHLPDCGRGDDVLERYVGTLASLPMLHAPGEMFSYGNSGFVVAGRVVEAVTGQTWDAALRSRLLDPLGSAGFATLPEEALRHRAAVGHLPADTADAADAADAADTAGAAGAARGWRVGQMWPELRSGGPAGFTPMATGRELLRFARLHLSGGLTGDGGRILSGESVAAMQEREVTATPSGPVEGAGWGLGWGRFRYGPGERVIGHNGGRSATLRVLPDRDLAIAVLTNATGGDLVGHHLVDAIIGELCGLAIPAPPDDVRTSADLAPYEGHYVHGEHRLRVSAAGDRLLIKDEIRDVPGQDARLTRPAAFLTMRGGSDVPKRGAFLELDGNGRPRYLHVDLRAFRRTDRP